LIQFTNKRFLKNTYYLLKCGFGVVIIFLFDNDGLFVFLLEY